MALDVIIFDCDGVLVDSELIANEQLRQALEGAGLSMTIEQVVETFVGLSMSAVIDISQKKLGADFPENFLAELQDKTFAAFEESLKPVDGIHEVLQTLSETSKKICVASSGSLKKIDLTLGLTGLKHFFKGNIFSSSQVRRGKPYPDIYLFAANQMDNDPSECLVIEDSLPGVQGAVAAGMEVLAYSARGQGKTLATAGGIVFSDMKDILKYIQ